MSDDQKFRCRCARCRLRGLMGPVVLITLGVLFFISEYSRVNFGQLWPILLIAIGVVKILEATASTEGHNSGHLSGTRTSAGTRAGTESKSTAGIIDLMDWGYDG